MIFISSEAFFQKADTCIRLNRDEEKACALRAKLGDTSARQQIIESYIPMVAGHIRHMQPHMQTLSLILYCLSALEHAVDCFDFLQDSEPFAHRLSWALRQATTSYIVR